MPWQVLLDHKIGSSYPFQKHAFLHAQPPHLLLNKAVWFCTKLVSPYNFINLCGHRDILTPFRKPEDCLLFAVEAEIFTLLLLGSR